MRKRLSTPSPALVVALIALFVALGGTSYAALTLPKDSVGTKQLKDGAVTAAKINSSAAGAVKVVGGPGAPKYQNLWHASDGKGDEGVSFYKDAFGVVHLQGSTMTGIAATSVCRFFFLMIRRPPRSTRCRSATGPRATFGLPRTAAAAAAPTSRSRAPVSCRRSSYPRSSSA